MAYTEELQAQKDWYNGIEFRSKLESKTAQALDNLGIDYVYEPDGYKLSNGMWYRPDFWLPYANQYIECKGVMSNEDSAKIIGLVEDTNHPVLVISYDNAMLVMRSSNLSYTPIKCYESWQIALAKCGCGNMWFMSLDDTAKCPSCDCCNRDGHLKNCEMIYSGQTLFNHGQKVAADKPIYQEIANNFNN